MGVDSKSEELAAWGPALGRASWPPPGSIGGRLDRPPRQARGVERGCLPGAGSEQESCLSRVSPDMNATRLCLT